MKRICCICIAILLCFGIYGCEKDDSDSSDVTSSLSSGESEIVSASEPASSDDDSVSESEPGESLPASSSDNESDTTSEPIDSLPPLSPDEAETIETEDADYVYGEIIGKMSPNALILKMDTPRMVNTWGKTVYIITDEADEWCVGDEIDVTFSKAERPIDTTQYVRIYADKIEPLMLVAKPIIYLYPETATECSVKVTLDGELTCTYPDHGADGWQDFTAYPDGTLVFPDGKEYYALYWEGIQNTEWNFSQGWCVRGEDTAEFLEWALAQQGLTPREANEFIIYWLPLMQDNAYNVISFQTETYTESAVLDISPTPDSLLRVFMAYYSTDTEVEIQPQTFEGFERKGFTVVEWGGSRVK